MKAKNQIKNKTLNGVPKGKVNKQKAVEKGAPKAAVSKAVEKSLKALKKPEKGAKKLLPKKVVIEEKEEEEEENDSEQEVEDDSGADVEISEQGSEEGEGNGLDLEGEDDSDEDDEDDDDDDDDEEEEDDDEEEGDDKDIDGASESDEDNPEGGESEGSDDEPVEVPIGKKPKTEQKSLRTGVPNIKTGNIPKDVPRDQIVIVKNLPPKLKQINIVEVFAKFGKISIIKTIPGEKNSEAHIAFTTAEAAEAALVTNKTKVKDRQISVTLHPGKLQKEKHLVDKEELARQREESKIRTIFVKNLKYPTTEEEVKGHFAECGTIESCNVKLQKKFCYAFVVFTDASAVEAALKLHNSELGGSIIGVFSRADAKNNATARDPKKTILVKNTQQLETFSGEKLKTIFSKCGEIDNIDLLCKKNVLAFIVFKEEKSVKKAFKLNGTTAEGLDIQVDEYKILPKTSVFLHNLKPGTTDTAIREFFESTGELDSVYIQPHYAIVRFKDTEGYCKSFLLNEGLLNGEMVFLEPYSERKQNIMKKAHLGKRRANGPPPFKKGFNPKKFKQN